MKYTQIEKKWIKSIPKHLKPSKAEIEKIIKRARKQRKERRDEFGF
jgi:translation initiation factor 2 alpha subunit (eIF-2alpha)